METLPLIFLFVLGACAGSFALAMTMRMFARKTWVNDRSRCDYCKKVLKWVDLIPLISWLSTRGTCRYCHKKLGRIYPTVELLTGVAFALSYHYWPYGFSNSGWAVFSLWLVMLTLLASLVVFDVKWQLLPDKITYTLVGLALVSKLFQIIYYQDSSRIGGLLLGALVGGGIFLVMYVVSAGRYIGGGDVKLGFFFGILLASGFKSLLVISIGSIVGTLTMLPGLVKHKTKMTSQIPFGPSLIVATFIVYLFGDKLVDFLTTVYLFP